ncbi:hypothetical protein JMM63_20445 [Rhodovulum sulfidophilum]|uniref:hypothetical protein n=1 Tax=Rhodovulum sulfidophilum TaxID=35806 RepID=UPI00192097B5|nr:hypothetical protein [Rhodovulum sulfidophilum]MBL3597890.1 hypothetical protein [Rhodovulum sulfidophilum]
MTEKTDKARDEVEKILKRHGYAPREASLLTLSKKLNHCAKVADIISNSKSVEFHGIKSKERHRIARGADTVREQVAKRTEYQLKKRRVGSLVELRTYLEEFVKSKCLKILADSMEREAKKKIQSRQSGGVSK